MRKFVENRVNKIEREKKRKLDEIEQNKQKLTTGQFNNPILNDGFWKERLNSCFIFLDKANCSVLSYFERIPFQQILIKIVIFRDN